jgi:hypothetical protein
MDPIFGPRAAINLVQLHEMSIPGARRALEEAAFSGTRMGDVYWALAEIYRDDAQHAWELMKVAGTAPPFRITPPQKGDESATQRGRTAPAEVPEVPMISYAHGDGAHFRYELLSPTGKGPNVRLPVAPYFPDELLNQRVGGKVVVDVQITDQGEVAGIWLISALPEVLTDLATTAVHDWKFNSAAERIRIVVQFIP